jgi:hypothetical protein
MNGKAEQLIEFFQLERMPRVPAEHYYDVVAQMITSRTGNWAAFGVGWNRTFQEITRVRSRYTHCNTLFAFDWWEGLPEDWRPGFPRGFFRIPRERITRWYLHDPSVVFVDGLFEESLTAEMVGRMGTLALVHIDCDLYSSTRTVLDRLPLAPGTILMFDEFYAPAGEWDWYEHEARAFHEVCVERAIEIWPLCRRDVASATLSEQAAFLIR